MTRGKSRWRRLRTRLCSCRVRGVRICDLNCLKKKIHTDTRGNRHHRLALLRRRQRPTRWICKSLHSTAPTTTTQKYSDYYIDDLARDPEYRFYYVLLMKGLHISPHLHLSSSSLSHLLYTSNHTKKRTRNLFKPFYLFFTGVL